MPLLRRSAGFAARSARGAALGMLLAASAACGLDEASPVGAFGQDTIAIAWRTPITDEFVGNGVAADGERLFALVDGVTAYDLATGRRVWQNGLGLEGGPDAPVTAGGRVFVASSQALALDARTGAELWRAPLDSIAPGLPAVDERALYVGTYSRRVYALDVATGRPLWSAEALPPTPLEARISGIVAGGDTLYVSIVEETSPTGHLMRGWIVAMDRGTGRVIWRYVNERAGEPHDAGRHAVAGRMLLVNDQNGGAFMGIDRFTGQQVWRRVGPSDRYGARDDFSVADGVAYLASNDTYAYAIQPETGQLLWRTPLNGSASSSAVCGEHLFADMGMLLMMRRADGSPVASLFVDEWGYVRPDEFVVSRLLSHGDRVYFVGYKHAYAVECAPRRR